MPNVAQKLAPLSGDKESGPRAGASLEEKMLSAVGIKPGPLKPVSITDCDVVAFRALSLSCELDKHVGGVHIVAQIQYTRDNSNTKEPRDFV